MGTKRIWRAVALGVAGAVAAASLAACGPAAGSGQAEVVQGKDQGPRLETRQAGSRRAGPVSPREFEFVRYNIDVSQDLPRACLMSEPPPGWEPLARSVEASAIHANHRHLTPALARAVLDAGFSLFCYTVNEPARATELLGWGVEAFCTDRIDLIGPDFGRTGV